MDPDRRSVKETYDHIGTHFSKTREYPWPEVEEFITAADEDGVGRTDRPAVGIDIGCGNGRHLELLASVAETAVGVDASRPVLVEARTRLGAGEPEATLLQGDATSLPLRSDVVDLAVYVATLHHLPSRPLRRASLDELARVLAPGGRALVSAWSTEHDRFDETEGFDTTVDWTLPDGETVPRYYHVYDPKEFAADLEASDLRVVSTRVSSGNCYARVG